MVDFSYTVFGEMVDGHSEATTLIMDEPMSSEVPRLSSQPDILPDCRLKQSKNVQYGVGPNALGLNWVPTFCANCGASGPLTPEENITFFFYLCNPCAEKWGPIAGMYMEPDAIFFERVKQEQMEKYGRELTPPEVIEVLNDENSSLSKLVKERRR